MNRRTFLKTTAVAATFSRVTAPAAQPVANGARLKIGFLGIGHSHASGKLKAVRESSDWELVGIHPENAKLAETYGRDGAKILSQDELLKSADVIAVESDARDHYRHGKIALTAGKHVHLEKPPAGSMAEFKELVELAKSRGRLLQMGYMWRYHDGISKMIEAVQRGWLGDITMVRGQINSQIDKDHRLTLAEFHGGAMWELGCHLIDALVRMMGKPDKITPFLRKDGSFDDKLNDNTLAVFQYLRAIATINVNLMQSRAGAHRFLEVIGTKGNAILQPIEPGTLQMELTQAAGPYTAKAQNVPLPKYERYVPELADLADAIRKKRPLNVTPETDLIVHETLLKACDMF